MEKPEKYIKFTKGVAGVDYDYKEVTILARKISAIQDCGNFINIWTGGFCWTFIFFKIKEDETIKHAQLRYEEKQKTRFTDPQRGNVQLLYQQISQFLFNPLSPFGNSMEIKCLDIDGSFPEIYCRGI